MVSNITWYNEYFVSISVIICLLSIIYMLITSLIWITDENSSPLGPIISLLIVVLSLVYIFKATNEQNAVLEDKYKYVVTVNQGEGYKVYYTNQYKIEDGIIYFDGNCASNFTVEINN